MLLVPLESPHPDHLQLPDVRRLERMPSLPEWVASRIASLTDEDQPDRSGKWRKVPTIPPHLILKAADRAAIEQHIVELDRLCAETPEYSAAAEHEMLLVLTAMMMVLPTTSQNELSIEARGEAFLEALDDLPVWSVRAARRKWHRGDCGRDSRGRPYDYHWCPAPAELRRIAFAQMWHVTGRARELRRLLAADTRIEFGDEHCRAMRARLAELSPAFRTPPVGKDGSGGVAGA